LNVFRTLQPEQQRNLAFLFGAGLMFWASLTALLPTLSLYIKDTGATDFQVGVVMGAFAIGLVIFRPWLGKLADRRDRKIVLCIGLFAVALAPLGYWATQSIPLLFLLRAFHGLSIAAFTTGFSAQVTDLAPPESRGEVLGYMTLVNPIGVAIGPALGGFLQDSVGYTPLFLTSAGLGALGLLLIRQLHAPTPERNPNISANQESSWQLLLSPRLRILALVLLLIGIAFGTLAIFVPLFIKETKVPLNPGLFYTAAAIASFVARIVVGPASDRFGRGRFVTGSLVIYASALALLAVAQNAPGFLLAGFLEGAGGAILFPMMIALTADRSHAYERGRTFSLVLAGFDLGMAIAGPIFGYFALFFTYRQLFTGTAFLALLALLSFIGLNSKSIAHSLRFALSNGHDFYALPRN